MDFKKRPEFSSQTTSATYASHPLPANPRASATRKTLLFKSGPPNLQASTSNVNLGGNSVKEEKSIIRSLLNRFFEARPSQEDLISRRVLQAEVHVDRSVPLRFEVVEKVLQYIEAKGECFL